MISFYGFYTTWSFFLIIMSSVILGFISEKYHIHSEQDCKVNEYKLTFDLYGLDVFLLATTIFTSLIQITCYFCTRYMDSSILRKVINIISSIIFIAQVCGACSMLYKFDKNYNCFSFYEGTLNGSVMLWSFIGLCVCFILQVIFVIVGLVSMCCCEEHDNYNILN